MGYLTSTARTIPRIALLYFGGVILVGYFALANALLSFSRMIPTIFAQFVYPAMSYTYGKTNNKKLLWQILKKYLFISFGLGIAIGIAANTVLPIFIEMYLPKYSEGIIAVRIVAWGTLFSGTGITMGALFAVDNKRLSAKIVAVSLSSLTILSFVLPIFIQSMIAISVAVVASEALIFAYTVISTYRFLMTETEPVHPQPDISQAES